MDTKSVHHFVGRFATPATHLRSRCGAGAGESPPPKAARHRLIPAITLVAILLLASACGRMQAARPEAGAAGYTLSLAVQPDPPMMGRGRLVITLADPAGRPVDAAQVHVEGNMTHAGMVPVLADSSTGRDGRYEIPFNWTMDGDWIVTVKAALPGGQTVTRDFPIRVGQ